MRQFIEGQIYLRRYGWLGFYKHYVRVVKDANGELWFKEGDSLYRQEYWFDKISEFSQKELDKLKLVKDVDQKITEQ